MDKGDPAAGGSATRYFVHQAIPGGSTCIESRVKIRHSIADVVDARSPFGEESPDGTLSGERGQQLHFGFTERQRDDSGAIRGLGRVRHEPENVAVKAQRGLQIGYGNSHMGDAGDVGQTASVVIRQQ